VNLAIWSSFAAYGWWIATIKRRNPLEGAAFGLLLGPFGCVVEAILRERSPEEIERERSRRQEAAQALLEERNKYRAALRVAAERHRQEARVRAEEARARREEVLADFSAWFDRTILQFGWYKALPDVAQPIILGIMVALPLVVVMILVLRKGH